MTVVVQEVVNLVNLFHPLMVPRHCGRAGGSSGGAYEARGLTGLRKTPSGLPPLTSSAMIMTDGISLRNACVAKANEARSC